MSTEILPFFTEPLYIHQVVSRKTIYCVLPANFITAFISDVHLYPNVHIHFSSLGILTDVTLTNHNYPTYIVNSKIE